MNAQRQRAQFEFYGLHLAYASNIGYGLGPNAQASVPEVRYDLDDSTLCIGGAWDLDDWHAIRALNSPTEAQRDVAYAWYYDSAPTGPDGGRIRFQKSDGDRE